MEGQSGIVQETMRSNVEELEFLRGEVGRSRTQPESERLHHPNEAGASLHHHNDRDGDLAGDTKKDKFLIAQAEIRFRFYASCSYIYTRHIKRSASRPKPCHPSRWRSNVTGSRSKSSRSFVISSPFS